MEPKYDIRLDHAFGPLQKVDIARYAQEHEPWWNQTLLGVNDCVVRIGVLDGDFHWHKHDEEDEFFYVLEGTLQIEFETHTVDLNPGQAILVPRGVLHYPRALGRVVVLMFEGAGVVPTGD